MTRHMTYKVPGLSRAPGLLSFLSFRFKFTHEGRLHLEVERVGESVVFCTERAVGMGDYECVFM